MPHPARLAVILLLLSLGPVGTAVARESVEQQILATLDEFARLSNARDWDGVIDLYSDDPRFQWMENGELAYPDKAAVAKTLHTLEPMVDEVDLRLLDPRVLVLSDRLAYASMRFEESVRLASGDAFRFTGAITILLQREDAEWRFLSGHTSSRPMGDQETEA